VVSQSRQIEKGKRERTRQLNDDKDEAQCFFFLSCFFSCEVFFVITNRRMSVDKNVGI
jgi:hypothetical protein